MVVVEELLVRFCLAPDVYHTFRERTHTCM